MKSYIALIMEQLKGKTLQQLADETGLNKTRLHRLRKGKEFWASELIAIAEAYGITPETFSKGQASTTLAEIEAQAAAQLAEIEALRLEVRNAAFNDVYKQAEMRVAAKYGMTPELMAWKLTAPKAG